MPSRAVGYSNESAIGGGVLVIRLRSPVADNRRRLTGCNLYSRPTAQSTDTLVGVWMRWQMLLVLQDGFDPGYSQGFWWYAKHAGF